jgi:LemA protein
MIIFWVVLGIVVIYLVASYNSFVRLINNAKEALADIDVQLKRRFDLIPNLVETVKGYASHEQETLQKVIDARNSAMSAMSGGNLSAEANAENVLSGTLKSLFALSENYPDLKANANFIELQRELSDTENKIQSSRRFYNANVRDLNTKTEMFPSNIVAKVFNFKQMEFFDLAESPAERENVQVKF